MNKLKIPNFITNLTDYLINIKNLSQTYITSMTQTLEQFLDFINVHKLKYKYNSIENMSENDIRALNNSDIYSFIYFLSESHFKTNSRITKIEHLKTFFSYLYTIKHSIFNEPFKKLNVERKKEEKLPNYLSLDEAKRLLNIYASSENEIEIRDNAILHLFLNSGIRLSELKNLNIDDIDLSNNKFLIIGKGNKERTGYINNITKNALEKYLEIRDKFNPIDNTLFVSRYGTKMSSTSIEKIVERAYQKAGIESEIYSVHTLRHTCATLLYKNGANIKTIQELLGHVRIDTTEIYTHLHSQKVMNAMLKHPLSKFKMADALAFCA